MYFSNRLLSSFITATLLFTVTSLAAGAFKCGACKGSATPVEAPVCAPCDKINSSDATCENDKISRALGHYLARHLKTPAVQYNIENVIEGMRDEAAGKGSPMTEEEFSAAVANLQAAHFEAMAKENLASAEKFLQTNAKESGVVCINDKLQYKVLKEGLGEVVAQDATPLIHFSCKLIDGAAISSSSENAEPISLPLKQALAGIRDGIVGMKEGEKRCLYIHPELGFGNASHLPPSSLPPNSLLIFEVEVLEAQTKAEQETITQETTAPTAIDLSSVVE